MASSCLLVATHLCNGHVYYTVCCHGDSSVEGHNVQVYTTATLSQPTLYVGNSEYYLSFTCISEYVHGNCSGKGHVYTSFMPYTQPLMVPVVRHRIYDGQAPHCQHLKSMNTHTHTHTHHMHAYTASMLTNKG